MQDAQTELFEKPFVFRRSSMDALADMLIDEIHAEVKNSDLFRRTRIIVPNRSIQRYLSLRFAHRHGIAAQLEFPSLMSIFQRFLPRTNERLNINEKTIAWRIYRILLEPEAEAAFPMLAKWIKGDSKRLYDLSRQLGGLYDKYMLYRPEWINAWEAGLTPQGLHKEPSAVWQGELWRRIAGQDWKGNHFAAVCDRIAGRSAGNGVFPCEGIKNGGETIRIFGFSQLPPAVLLCLEQFHRFGMTVKLYHLVPSGEYYADCKSNKDELRKFLNKYFHEDQDPVQLLNDMNSMYFQHNPLLASFAMQSCVMLNRTSEWIDDADFDHAGEDADAPETGTILQRLQKRIRDDLKPTGGKPAKRKKGSGCRSVQIRNCYSAFREVEAAHDFILHCLDEDHDLPLKNIFIMTPSPADYAPLVDAVFNHSGDLRLGVSIADQPQTERMSSYSTLMKILSLFKGSFAASEVFGILQDRSLQEHWGISPDDWRYCLSMAMQAGIRWGWDEREHEQIGGKAFPENSWQAGFDRMLLDYAVEADPVSPYRLNEEDEVFPVSGFDGGMAELLGKFISLVSKLHETAQIMRRRDLEGVPFREWETMLAESTGFLFGWDSELKNLLLSVLNIWHQTLTEAGTEDVPLTSGIVLAYLRDKHAKPEDNTMGFMRGKITFCGLRPMRSIPADAVLLLGMDHKSFPEEDDDREFDIMQQYRQGKDSGVGREPGDPLRRDESRQLFLDTIMAARKYLYISYVGRDIHDRKEKPPSVCVDELRNYLIHEFGKNSFIELKDPLHAFSPELFVPGAANQSFSEKMRDAAKQIAGQSSAGASGEKPSFDIRAGIHPETAMQTDAGSQSMEFDDLIRFFANPADKFIRDSLDASLSVQETSSPEDTEPFENNLGFDAQDELLQSFLDSSDRDALKSVSLRKLKADGSVPLLQDTEDWQDWSRIAMLAGGIETNAAGLTERLIQAGEMDVAYSAADAGELAGLIYDTVPEGVFRTVLVLPEMKVYEPAVPEGPCVRMEWSLAKELSGAILIRPILNHLRANLVRRTETRLVFLDKYSKITVLKAEPMERSDAETFMKRFLCFYHAGMLKPLPFFPKTSYAFFAEQDEQKKASKAASCWDSGWNGGGDVEKYGSYFGAGLQIGDCFSGLAEAFFGTVAFQQEKKPGKGRGKKK